MAVSNRPFANYEVLERHCNFLSQLCLFDARRGKKEQVLGPLKLIVELANIQREP